MVGNEEGDPVNELRGYAAKLQVKTALVHHVVQELRAVGEGAHSEADASQLDQESSLQVDDLSQSDEAGDLAGLLDRVAGARRDRLSVVRQLDFGYTDTVRPGAIVAFDGQRYVVGVAASSFVSGGNTYECIAADAPIYAAMAGRRAGETFTFNGEEHVIDFVS